MKFLKWISSIGLTCSLILTAYNIYPYNIYLALPSTIGWITVSIIWKENSLIMMNVVAFLIYFLGLLNSLGITLW